MTLVVSSKDARVTDAIQRQFTAVPLDQDSVAQSTDATAAVCVRSQVAKFRPPSVAVDPPEKGVFPTPAKHELTAGACVGKSNVMPRFQFQIIQ